MTIVHELCHNCVHHLPVPGWVNEGVAVTLERKISREIIADLRDGIMDADLAQRHHAFWNEENIQEFWAGTTFYMKDEAQALSYSLAEVLVHKLSGDHRLFLDFLASAHYDDAGQTAALDVLGINLGDAVAISWVPANGDRSVRKWLNAGGGRKATQSQSNQVRTQDSAQLSRAAGLAASTDPTKDVRKLLMRSGE
jgi:hypothetical protein